MKKLFLSMLALSYSAFLFAIKDLQPFGKIDKEDLSMKECSYDKDATAFKLISYGDVHYDIIGDNFSVITEKRVRIKILKEKGLDEANIKLYFLSKSGYEMIQGISGITYNLDNSGKITTTKLDKSAIFFKKLNNRVSEVSFTLPNVKVGSVFEYKFTDTKKNIDDVDNWYFQDDIPVRLSIYQITIPSIFRFVSQVLAYQKVEEDKKSIRETVFYHSKRISYLSDIKTYTLRDITALRKEPYMGAPKDYLQRVIYQLSAIDYGEGDIQQVRSTWPELIHDLLKMDEFGLQLDKNIPHTEALKASLKNANDDFQKMVIIHDYVRKNMNWNGGETIYSIDGIKSAWDKKSGTNAELNFILIDLLREAGLEAFPLLVSTKDNGMVRPIYPFLDQFNGVMTLVIIGEKRYVLNAADKYNPAYLIPYDVLGNQAFIVDNSNGGWITLSDNNHQWRSVVSYFANISPDAQMKGTASILSYGYYKNQKMKQWEENRSSFGDDYKTGYTAMKISDIKVEDADVDTLPLKQTVQFSLPLNSSGDYKYFSINLFQGLETNPFIENTRMTDIDFNFKRSYTLVGKVFIPDGYEFEALPKNVRMIMPDTSISFERLIQQTGTSIDFRITLNFNRAVYSGNNYELFYEFYKQLFSKLNEQIVIKKKKVS